MKYFVIILGIVATAVGGFFGLKWAKKQEFEKGLKIGAMAALAHADDPASERQLQALRNLMKEGKVKDIPNGLNKAQASKLISGARTPPAKEKPVESVTE